MIKLKKQNKRAEEEEKKKEEYQTQDHGVDSKHWPPVVSQDIQTHVTLQVDVRVVNWRDTQALWRVMWVARAYLNGELISPALPDAVFV